MLTDLAQGQLAWARVVAVAVTFGVVTKKAAVGHSLGLFVVLLLGHAGRGEQAGGTLALVGRRGLVGVGLLLCLHPRPLRHAHHQVDHLRPDVLVDTVRFLGAVAKLRQPLEIVQEGAHARCHLENVARLRYGEDGLIVALVEKALEDGVSKHFSGAGGHRLEA